MVVTEKKFFYVTSVHRDDLTEYIPSPIDRARIPDDWMQALADRIGDATCETGVFWQVCEDYAEEIKKQFFICHCCGESPCMCREDYSDEEWAEQPSICKKCDYLSRCKYPKEAEKE